MAHLSAPPYFLDIKWPEAAPFVAEAVDDFWIVYRISREKMRSIGLTVAPAGGNKWNVAFDPTKADADTIKTTLADLRERAHTAAVKASEVRIEAERIDDERFRAQNDGRSREENRLYWREFWAAKHAREEAEAIELVERVAAVKAEGHALLETFGEFTDEKPALRRMLAMPKMNRTQLAKLEALIAGTHRKSDARLEIARSQTGGVTWPDHVVVEAVRYLTGLDADRATDPNHEGWGRATSPGGHWAHAMMNREPKAAIAAARLLVGRHVDQLREGGII